MQKTNALTCFKSVLFTLVLFWQTSLFANNVAIKKAPVKLIQIKIVKLTDNRGLTYVGGKVNQADLELYLSQMKAILAHDFTRYRQNQSARDHLSFHITLINPHEYQTLAKDVALGTTLSVSLRGLGRVTLNDKKTYFVVAQSPQAKSYRQRLVLADKDFHVTLGFSPTDIYGVNKGLESLIK